ncbi:MAG TPA: hypothetical protein VEI57_10810 [Nitrospirota bacterium]|nr:hypothetical protein [Nitrospirota bacterium]
MNNYRLTAQPNSTPSLVHGNMCPYKRAENDLCFASVMTVVLDSRKKATYCCTEDHDGCPLYLAKVLRGK